MKNVLAILGFILIIFMWILPIFVKLWIPDSNGWGIIFVPAFIFTIAYGYTMYNWLYKS